MVRLWVAVLALLIAGCTTTRDFAATDHRLPDDRPVTILVMRPDVEVSSITAGGVPQPNADWTEQARAALVSALEADQGGRGHAVRFLPEQSGEAARLVADYEHLHRAVADQIARFKYGAIDLPTKRGRFDWTLGPGVARLGALDDGGAVGTGAPGPGALAPGVVGTGDAGPGRYALFLHARDSFATGGRVALQVLGAMLGSYVPGGHRFAVASLVDLSTGDIVWFNILSSARGDIRDADGARSTVETLMETMPSRATVAEVRR